MDKEVFREEMKEAMSKPLDESERQVFALFVRIAQSIAEELKEIKILLRQK